MRLVRVLFPLDRGVDERIFLRCRSVVAANISQLVKLVSRVEIASIEVSVSVNRARKVLASENLRRIA